MSGQPATISTRKAHQHHGVQKHYDGNGIDAGWIPFRKPRRARAPGADHEVCDRYARVAQQPREPSDANGVTLVQEEGNNEDAIVSPQK